MESVPHLLDLENELMKPMCESDFLRAPKLVLGALVIAEARQTDTCFEMKVSANIWQLVDHVI